MKRYLVLLMLVLITAASSTYLHAEKTPDANGTKTGTITNVTAKTAGQPTIAELGDEVGHSKIAINMVWLLLCGFLVFFMQAGFALVETGFTRAKNVAHTMAMNLFVYPAGMLAFYVCGFAIMFGGVGALGTLGGFDGLNQEVSISFLGHTFGLFGTKGFFMNGMTDVAVLGFFVFQVVFMDAAATIPTGAMAERWKFASFAVFGFIVGGLIYPIFGNWVWGGGWLATLGSNFGLGHGHVDFAGSSVVHLTGGVLAFIGAKMIGPRIGKYNKNGTPNAIPGHNIPMAVLGTIILAFGWFGFNSGSTLAGADLRFTVVAFNTMIASCGGALTATLWMWFVRGKKPDVSMMCNGLLAGLVAITAPCAFVSPFGGLMIGLISGILVVEVAFFVDRKLRIDDPVGAIAVHGANGIWGCLALGLFADGTYGDGLNGVVGNVTGLFYGGGTGQFAAEFIGVSTNLIFVGLSGWAVYKLLDIFIGNRVSAAVELEGLDVSEMGAEGYSGIKLDKNAETPQSR